MSHDSGAWQGAAERLLLKASLGLLPNRAETFPKASSLRVIPLVATGGCQLGFHVPGPLGHIGGQTGRSLPTQDFQGAR